MGTQLPEKGITSSPLRRDISNTELLYGVFLLCRNRTALEETERNWKTTNWEYVRRFHYSPKWFSPTKNNWNFQSKKSRGWVEGCPSGGNTIYNSGKPQSVNHEGKAEGLGEQILETWYSNRGSSRRRKSRGWKRDCSETTIGRMFLWMKRRERRKDLRLKGLAGPSGWI